MKITEVLTESLNSVLNYTKTKDNSEMTVYKIDVGNDRLYTVVFKFLTNDPNITGLKHYDLEFADHTNRQGINNALGHSSIKLFSTITEILKEFLKNNYAAIQFAARSYEGSRVKLYDRLIDRVKIENYEISREISGNYIDYHITPKLTKVNESFDSSYNYTLARKTEYNYVYKFETENKEKFNVIFDDMAYEDSKQFSFEFMSNNVDDFISSGTVDVTGSQGPAAIKVFSTVGKILNDFINEVDPDYVEFSIDPKDTSRVKLYDVLIKRMSKSLTNYTVKSGGNQYMKVYWLTKKGFHG